jgi:predicted nucleic acid-binding protein
VLATPVDVVVDASALIRGLQCEAPDAEELVLQVSAGTVTVHAPDLLAPECTNALLRLVRAGRLTRDEAAATLQIVGSSLIHRHSSAPHAHDALDVALASGISAYDAFYVVLAEALDIPLVTADRRLGEAIDRAVIVGSASSDVSD